MDNMHEETRHILVRIVDPDHAERKESKLFRNAKRRLKVDGHFSCYICGAMEQLQVHHRAAEYMFQNVVDFEKLKNFVEEWDIYGYGRLLKNQPITSVDDIRNQMVLCQTHHIAIDHEAGGSATGIHFLPFPEWIMQKLALPSADPVPQPGETFQAAEARVKAHERTE